MSGGLTTHVLDTATGRPAEGVRIELSYGGSADPWESIVSVATNADGRVDAPLLQGTSLKPGPYTLRFHVGEYFRRNRVEGAGTFLDVVPIVFTITDPTQHYHVPLLVTPWSYSTYRGS